MAEQLRREVTLGLILTGGALPPERELARMLGVGRATVQQAIRLLESEKLVERRRGRTGGTFVRGGSRGTSSSRSLLVKLRRDRDVIQEALTYRLDLEPAAAARAASLREARDLSAIGDAFARGAKTTNDADAIRLDTQFHLAIGAATHNRFFVDGVERIRLALADALRALPESALWQERSHREHGSIRSAIESGDVEAARRSMLLHVKHTDQSIRALLGTLSTGPSPRRRS